MNKKGFTLMEVVAILVILGGISLLVTPRVIKIQEKAKKLSAINNAYQIIDVVKQNRYKSIASGNITTYDLTNDLIDYSGKKPEKGYLIISDNKIALRLYQNGYCVIKTYDEQEPTATKTFASDCDCEIPNY